MWVSTSEPADPCQATNLAPHKLELLSSWLSITVMYPSSLSNILGILYASHFYLDNSGTEVSLYFMSLDLEGVFGLNRKSMPQFRISGLA